MKFKNARAICQQKVGLTPQNMFLDISKKTTPILADTDKALSLYTACSLWVFQSDILNSIKDLSLHRMLSTFKTPSDPGCFGFFFGEKVRIFAQPEMEKI